MLFTFDVKALISPEDLYRACTLFEELDLPVMLCRFASGVLAIQLHILSRTFHFIRILWLRYSFVFLNFRARSIGENTWLESVDFLLQERNFITAIELAKSKGIAVSLAKEELLVRSIITDMLRF